VLFKGGKNTLHALLILSWWFPWVELISNYTVSSRQPKDSDVDCYRDSSSDGSSDCELENSLKYARDWSRNHLVNGSTFGMDRLSVRENHLTMQEGFSSDDSDAGNSQGRLIFQHLERDPPYSREPLSDKARPISWHLLTLVLMPCCFCWRALVSCRCLSLLADSLNWRHSEAVIYCHQAGFLLHGSRIWFHIPDTLDL